ncbi:HAD family hydrolase [Caviibacter abscessus]|uniref:HAD family hydrolase n=1 Tax=Caviibacter abscessus TaxID=1766719 RepID=UPI000831A05E|nr:HAD hydrolase-like protein [Caviibacter abscessus]
MEKKIICIDSDGCVMDTMNYKHELCFGPLAADFWEVKEKDEFLKEWNTVNLFSDTRGINRFKGLYLTFEKMNKKYPTIPKLNDVKLWAENAQELSNASLKREIEKNNSEELKKALMWSEKVNEKIASLEGLDKPFEKAKEALEHASKYTDVAIVSSANKEAILSEWQRHGLLEYVNEVMGQDKGTKKDCISFLISKGYDANNILMIGDSPGDIEAAKLNNVKFYPIMFNDEKNSWEKFSTEILDEFLNGIYDEKSYVEKYNKLLKKYSKED